MEYAVIGEEGQRSALLDRKRLLNKALLNGMPEPEYDAEMEGADYAASVGRSSGPLGVTLAILLVLSWGALKHRH